MTATIRIVIAIIIALVLVAGALVLWRTAGEGATPSGSAGTQRYTNSTYDYSLTYPNDDTVKELIPEFTSIGQTTDGAFTPLADVAVLHAGLEEPLPSYDDFERLSAELACGLNPKQTGGACSTVASKDSFTSASGAAGEAYTFSGGSGGSQGPFYAFNISDNTSGGKYAVLLIYPHEGSGADPSLIQGIANSVQIQKK